MRYFKAVAIDVKPFIQWHGWANSLKELEDMNEEGNPLIMAEADIPPFLYNVCPLKIEGGELVERSEAEMEGYEQEYLSQGKLSSYKTKARELDNAFFEYDGHSFPMHEVARLFYSCLDRSPVNAKVLSTAGIYNLAAGNIPDFIDAFYLKLKDLTQAEV